MQYNRVALNTRLDARSFDLRTRSNQAIFRITSAVGQLFREFLDSQGFIEIHTPKLQGAATESGASVFSVDYFKRKAFLAQSPQLAKQMCIAGDMERVYEVGPGPSARASDNAEATQCSARRTRIRTGT